jgi:hypothetical protein
MHGKKIRGWRPNIETGDGIKKLEREENVSVLQNCKEGALWREGNGH